MLESTGMAKSKLQMGYSFSAEFYTRVVILHPLFSTLPSPLVSQNLIV